MIAIVNYGIGNLDSVMRALHKAGAQAVVAQRPEDLGAAHGIILPGVGSFDEAMENLRTGGFLPVLNHFAFERQTPILGICLGMQMLTKRSDEGKCEGLGWIDGETRRFDFSSMSEPLKVPHMGWNDLAAQNEAPLLAGIHPAACFYFAHSYYVACNDPQAIMTTTTYGHPFVSSVAKGRIFGIQFHPEKSHANGLQLLRNFIGITQNA